MPIRLRRLPLCTNWQPSTNQLKQRRLVQLVGRRLPRLATWQTSKPPMAAFVKQMRIAVVTFTVLRCSSGNVCPWAAATGSVAGATHRPKPVIRNPSAFSGNPELFNLCLSRTGHAVRHRNCLGRPTPSRLRLQALLNNSRLNHRIRYLGPSSRLNSGYA